MAAEAPARTLRDKIGGRWSVSWQGYLIELPISVLFVITSVPAFQSLDTIGFGLVVSLLGYLATGVVLWLASVTVLRHRRVRPAPVIVVVVVAGLAWALRSGVVAASLEWADLPSSASALSRLVFGFTLGAVSVPMLAWILDNLADFRRRREAALERLVEEQVAVDRQATYVEAMRAGLVEQVEVALDEARIDVDRLDLSAASMPTEALDAMQRVSKEAVRRISHETWQEGQSRARLRATDVVRMAATAAPFRVWSLIVLVPFWMVVAARAYSWGPVALAGLAGAGYLVLVIAAANRWVPRAPRPVVAYWISVLLLGGAGVVVYIVLAGHEAADPGPIQLALLASVMVMIVIPATGLARAMGVAEGLTIAALEASISQAEVRRRTLSEQERRLRREIAIALHGTVGANLTAATMRMRNAMDHGDVRAATEALAESRRLLDVDLHSLLLREHGDVKLALEDLADQWFGLVQITIDVEDDLEVTPMAAQALIDVVTEGISNSVGHGGATVIEIAVLRVGGVIRVVIDDDGQPPMQAAPGLGSRMLDAHARGRWSRQAKGPQGSRLSIELDS